MEVEDLLLLVPWARYGMHEIQKTGSEGDGMWPKFSSPSGARSYLT